VVNLWQTEKASIQFKYYRGKNKRKIAIVVSARGKATDELDDILTIAAKTEIQTTFREF
jgi:aspartokinase